MKKTSISFGLVNIPIEMKPVIKNNDITFNQIHKKCGSRIKYIKYCPHCKREVKQADIVKGYEYESNEYVTLTTEEFSRLKSEDEKTIEIIGFVDIKEIDPVFFEKSYVLNPPSKSKSYSLFRSALEKTKMVAIAKTVIGTKFYYVVIREKEHQLFMNTLYFLEEVVLPEETKEVSFTKKELDLAVQLMTTLKTKFIPEDYVDEYQEKVKKAVNMKIAGNPIKAPKKKQQKNIKDLMSALELSLKNVS